MTAIIMGSNPDRPRHILAACLLVVMTASGASPAAADKPAPDPAAGRAAYQQHCARCHGEAGKADGYDAKRLFPRPRDLTSGVFKFRTTASGTSPTDEDLFATITNGLTAGGMPDWSHLDEPVRWQLVYYIKTLTPNFDANPPQPVSLGTDPTPRRVDLAKGRQAFEKLGCAACHGAAGRANGISAATMTDDWGQAIRPADLTQGWNYRGGSDPKAIVTRMLTGIDGAQMPSYAEAATVDESWQLAYYVRSLQEEPRWTSSLRARHLADALPDHPEDPRWAQTERATVRLRPVVDSAGEMTAPATVSAVTVQTLYNEESIAFRLAWHDPSESREAPRDAIALVWEPAEVAGDVITMQTWPLRDSLPLDLCVWSAGAQPDQPGAAREVVAARFEPALGGSGGRPLTSHASYHDGAWTVVLTRPLGSEGLPGRGAALQRGARAPFALVVWDGGNEGRRTASSWTDVELQAPTIVAQTAATGPRWIQIAAAVVLVIGLGLTFRKSRRPS